MDKILFEQVPDLFSSIGNLFVEKKEELCEMDARLGDGQDRKEKSHSDDGHIPQLPQPQGGFGLQIVWIDKHR